MVLTERTSLSNVLVETIRSNDRVMLKSILESFTFSRSSQLKTLLNNTKDFNGFTPLQYVCLEGKSMFASLLIDSGSTDVNEKGRNGWTSLHAAVSCGDIKTVQLLLNSCADCFARDNYGHLPIDYATSIDVKNLLRAVMQEKNLELFQRLSFENNLGNNKVKLCGRSISCPPPSTSNLDSASFLSMDFESGTDTESETDTDSDTCGNISTTKGLSKLRKWKTFANLSASIMYNDTSDSCFFES